MLRVWNRRNVKTGDGVTESVNFFRISAACSAGILLDAFSREFGCSEFSLLKRQQNQFVFEAVPRTADGVGKRPFSTQWTTAVIFDFEAIE